MLVRRGSARDVLAMQHQAAAHILATWRANAFLLRPPCADVSYRTLVGVRAMPLRPIPLFVLIEVWALGMCGGAHWIRSFSVVVAVHAFYTISHTFASFKQCNVMMMSMMLVVCCYMMTRMSRCW